MATDLSLRESVPQEFKVTYATLGAPNPALHEHYDRALERVRAWLGQEHPMLIGGREVSAGETFEDRSPINTEWLLGRFQAGTAREAREALTAARRTFPAWSHTPWPERVAILRRAAALIESRLYELSALAGLEVGKNRLEAIADAQEAADYTSYYCGRMEANNGFVVPMAAESPKHANTNVLRPYGVWVVISPFNFPCALAGGPIGAALVAGNTVVFKPASDTAYVGLELVRCFLDAGLPDGALNLATGAGGTVGAELVASPEVDGLTFTGSYDVGMSIYRVFAGGSYPRPCIAEMGGKNPAIISRKADLDLAAMGVMRSAFGLQGQKCSACSRIYVERPVAEAFTARLLALTEKIAVGDPTRQDVWLGPVINAKAYMDYDGYCRELAAAGRILVGGRYLRGEGREAGYFCAPTVASEVPAGHRLWRQEMFLPITLIAAVDSLDEAMQRANDIRYGLTAGFFSADPAEIQWFFDHIQAGVAFVNRQGGATTGAWPGYQSFGGWKGSGSTGVSAGGPYYVQRYMHEQSRTVVAS